MVGLDKALMVVECRPKTYSYSQKSERCCGSKCCLHREYSVFIDDKKIMVWALASHDLNRQYRNLLAPLGRPVFGSALVYTGDEWLDE